MSRLGPGIHVVRFLLLALVQGGIVNELELGMNVYPMIYILFILLLPIELPAWLCMLIGFVYGLVIDWFSGTIGMHISACVFLAAARPVVLRILAPREGYEFGSAPGINLFGFRWFLSYAGLMVLLHHTWFFFIEVFKLDFLGDTLLRIFLSSLVSVGLIILIQFLFYRPNRTT